MINYIHKKYHEQIIEKLENEIHSLRIEIRELEEDYEDKKELVKEINILNRRLSSIMKGGEYCCNLNKKLEKENKLLKASCELYCEEIEGYKEDIKQLQNGIIRIGNVVGSEWHKSKQIKIQE